MSTLLDNFNRANENPLAGGSNWATRNVSNSLQLSSNQVTGTSNTILSSRYWAPRTFGPNCETSVTIATLPTSGRYARLFLRLTNPGASGETGYAVQYAQGSGLQILKETARESLTQIASNATSFSAGDIFTFRALGTTIEVLKNGVSVLSVVDSTYTAAGYIALGAGDQTIRLDDFSGETILIPKISMYGN